jgi:UDP-galactopyranose mutase
MTVDWLIVGAGLTGVTLAERIANILNQRVLLVERRSHIGGNAYDEFTPHGILVHRYGPHIFHTNDQQVWQYLSQFTTWRPYYHRVRASIDGQQVPLPFNLNSLHALFPPGYAARLEEALLRHYPLGARVPIATLLEQPQGEVRELAEFIHEKIFLHYTRKQWGMDPAQLSPAVTARVPIAISRDDRYFQDTYQAMPQEGYTAMFHRMLDHPRIRWLLNTDYRTVAGEIRYGHMIYTGCIDEFFNHCYGPLPYRSLRFDITTLPQERMQEVGTVNYPCNFDFTRITEQKHLTGQSCAGTVLVTEYPQAHTSGENEPYYPVPQHEAEAHYARYRDEAAKVRGRMIFTGRLGEYRYYNMDQAVGRALSLFETEIATCPSKSALSL